MSEEDHKIKCLQRADWEHSQEVICRKRGAKFDNILASAHAQAGLAFALLAEKDK